MTNDYVLDLFLGKENIYLSYDSLYSSSSDSDLVDDIHTLEFLRTINTSELTKHKLKFKVGVSIMLLRHIDQSLGLCNGTQLIIIKMEKYIVEENIISESNIEDKVFISRLSLTPFDVKIPFKI